MDEPLGALDKRLRETLQVEIKQLHQELGITFVYVTHDQDEALLAVRPHRGLRRGADRAGRHGRGALRAAGHAFVAEFLGDSNIFTGVLDGGGGAIRLDGGDADVRVADRRGARPGEPVAVDGPAASGSASSPPATARRPAPTG